MSPARPGHHLWVLDAGGQVLASGDGGATWSVSELAPEGLGQAPSEAPWSEAPRAIVFADSRRGWVVGRGGDAWSTGDGGVTWALSRLPAGAYAAVAAGDERHVWAVGGAGDGRPLIVRSTDGGRTWRRQAAPGSGRLTAVDVTGSRRGWAAGASMGRLRSFIVATAGRGTRWGVQYETDGGLLLTGIDFVDSRHGWAVGRVLERSMRDDTGVVFSTTDGGATWRARYRAPRALHAVAAIDADRAVAVGDAGLVVSTRSGGRTWARQRPGTAEPLRAVVFSDARNGWILVGRSSLLTTADGGTTWVAVGLGRDLFVSALAALYDDSSGGR